MFDKASKFFHQGALADQKGANLVEWVAVIVIIVKFIADAVGAIGDKVVDKSEAVDLWGGN
jgi:hypothetical protein